jgi:hypothetical protein
MRFSSSEKEELPPKKGIVQKTKNGYDRGLTGVSVLLGDAPEVVFRARKTDRREGYRVCTVF